MSRHRVSYPQVSFDPREDQRLLRWQEHFVVDDRPLQRGLSAEVDDRAADLLDIAVAAYITDRLHPRRPERSQNNGRWWSRSLSVRIPVRNREAWIDTGAFEGLLELLPWLTDDEWRVDLVDASPQRSGPRQAALFADDLAAPVDVALFSGGLDSLLGADQDLRGDGELILVSAGTNGRMIGLQRSLAKGLAELGPRRLRLVSLPVFLTDSGKRRLGERVEQSQRTRGLLFGALGAAVARAAGGDGLRIHENGPGALNLPLTSGQLGSMNTRAARPETLRLLSTMLSRLFQRPFEIVNPAFWKTKAEMCRQARPELDALIRESITCDTGLTRRVDKGRRCAGPAPRACFAGRPCSPPTDQTLMISTCRECSVTHSRASASTRT